MSNDRHVVAARRRVTAKVVRRWAQLDTDWKSVAWGLAIVGFVVGFDVSIPG
ncbi:hypothetical protein HAPAU_34020 [Halalkalicoccus paucihalophilus]|uniref:Uncharacterized protein n=1 Tax=Halalkalicoccus paucihalophilus TaxID=1008153 RepID=A0A151A9X6_9EURY|nr:hypothetical protein [Halalkalicoccus paucihalophilus]KYH24419.1 hypothetical protein HAPAU_34020 [Halalkalicoccus paucihalophilus]